MMRPRSHTDATAGSDAVMCGKPSALSCRPARKSLGRVLTASGTAGRTKGAAMHVPPAGPHLPQQTRPQCLQTWAIIPRGQRPPQPEHSCGAPRRAPNAKTQGASASASDCVLLQWTVSTVAAGPGLAASPTRMPAYGEKPTHVLGLAAGLSSAAAGGAMRCCFCFSRRPPGAPWLRAPARCRRCGLSTVPPAAPFSDDGQSPRARCRSSRLRQPNPP